MGGSFFLPTTIPKDKKSQGLVMLSPYPLFIFIVAMGMVGFLITFVVPKITGIFEDTGQELPEITQFVLAISDFLTNHYMLLFIVFISTIIFLKILYRYSYSYRKLYDSMILKLPIIGQLTQNYELGRFSYILSLMLESGVSYAHAVKLATSTFQ